MFQRLKPWLVPFFTLTLCTIVMVFLYQELHKLELREIVRYANSIPISHLTISVGCMVLAYLSLSFYEVLALKYASAHVSYRRAASTAFMAYAIGHNIGFASLSGGAMRYRMYSLVGLSATQVAKVILFGSATFGLGLAFLTGIVLLTLPADTWQQMHITQSIIKPVAIGLLLAVGTYLVWAMVLKKPLTFKMVKIDPPENKLVVGQFIAATLDLSLAALVLFVLLPNGSGITFLHFFPVFLIAIGIGSLSSVPGGLGVFEAILIAALPELPKESLLGSILVYRVIYFLLPLAVSVTGFLVHEYMLNSKKISVSLRGTNDWMQSIAPVVASALVFVAGCVLLLSGATPSIDARIDFIKKIMPLPLLELSHLVGSICGIALLILSRGLFKRLKGSFHITLVLLGLGALGSLLKGVDYEEAILLSIVAAMLLSVRKEFYRSTSIVDERFTFGWIVSVTLVVLASVWIGFVSHHNLDYSDQLWWQFAFNADAPRLLRATLVVSIILIGFFVSKLFNDAGATKSKAISIADPDTLAKIKLIVAQASDTQANLALLGDKQFLIHPNGDAFIMYQCSGNSWITMGDPIGNPERAEELAWSFRTLCDQHNALPVFYQVSEEFLAVFVDMGLSLSKLGEEGVVALQGFSLQGSARADLRQAVNRINKLNAVFSVVPSHQVATILDQIETVSNEWMNDKNTSEKSFSLGSFSRPYMENFDTAIVTIDGKIVAFANLWFSGNKVELSLDLMRYSRNAPKGVMDYLFTQIMLWGSEQGYQSFSLGMAPLSGLENHALAPVWHKIGTLVFRYGETFYNFEGLRSYKEKFHPDWHPRYIATTSGFKTPVALLDTTRLISGGLAKVFA